MNSSRHSTVRRAGALASLVLAPGGAAAGLAGLAGYRAEEKPRALQATLEILRPFTYEGEPLMVRVAVFNTGDQPYDNAAGINLAGGLKVVSASRGKLA